MDTNAQYRCDIIVVTWNKLDYIRECVEAIVKNTDLKSRLIIVDNASAADVREYLKGLVSSAAVDIKMIFNDTNLGPGKARNIALKQVDADYVCFVDSDAVVGAHWLSSMAHLMEAHPEIGMLNPSSNNFNQVPGQGVSIDDYAASLAPLKDGYLEVGHCISFCMLIKREVVKKIGFLDEEYILALYEDTDYSMKASAAGFVCAIAKGAYVWHYGHGSTGRVKKINEMAEKNRDRFYKKWGRPLRIFYCVNRDIEKESLKEELGRAVKLARDGNYVYLFAIAHKTRTREDTFRECGMIEHANVHLSFLKGAGFRWRSLFRVLIKRKKRYNLVVSGDKGLLSLIKGFGFLHSAGVVYDERFEDALAAVKELKFHGG